MCSGALLMIARALPRGQMKRIPKDMPILAAWSANTANCIFMYMSRCKNM